MKSILDPSFRYTPSSRTDVRKTFARIRRMQALANAAQSRGETAGKVLALDIGKRAPVGQSGQASGTH